MTNCQSIIQERVFRWILATGLCSAIAVGTTDFSPKLSLIVCFLAVCLMLTGRLDRDISWLTQILSVLALIRAGADWRAGVPGIVALTEFALIIMVLQWLIVRSLRSGKQALLLAIMLIFATAAMNVNFLFPLALLPFCFCLIGSLHELTVGDRFRAFFRAKYIPWGAWATFAITFGTLLCVSWVGLFYLFPRPEIFGLSPSSGQRKLKGFSDLFRLGDGGLLEDNPMVVMRIRPMQESLLSPSIIRRLQLALLRGYSYTEYKKSTWSRDNIRRNLINLRHRGGSLSMRKPPNDLRPEIWVEILLEPIDPPILFIPDQAFWLNSAKHRILLDSDRSVTMLSHATGVEVYQVHLKLGAEDPLDWDCEPSEIPGYMKMYVDVGDADPKIGRLARKIASGARTISEKIVAIRSYLHKTCRYSLREQPSVGTDPLADFLFRYKSGSCEHFASAMVIMLRFLGVAARPVNGYRMGEWNEFGQFFTVRQRNAHAWAEVYFAQHKWVTIDPTPVAEAGFSTDSTYSDKFLEIWSKFEGFWFQYVYRFNRETQLVGFSRMKARVEGIMQLIRRSGEQSLIPGVIFVCFALGFILYRRYRSVRGLYPSSWLPRWYLDWIIEMPVKRESWETPKEFHSRLLETGVFSSEAKQLLLELDTVVKEAAFGHDPATWETKGLLVVGQLQSHLRTSAPSASPRE